MSTSSTTSYRHSSPVAARNASAGAAVDGVSSELDARHRRPERVTGAQSVVRALEELGVAVVFGIPGGAILPVYDPLFDSVRVRHVLVRHEQAAGHAATGYAQATGKVGVCMATSGPGATNLVTPLATHRWTPSLSSRSPDKSAAV